MGEISLLEAENERRPVLYNGDETWYRTTAPERADRRYLEGLVDHLAAAKITVFSNTFYSAGRCYYDTTAGERWDKDLDYIQFSDETGRFEPGHFSNWRCWHVVTNFRRLLEEGNDPIQVFIDRCHEKGLKFLACLRMNDRHAHNVAQPSRVILEHPEMTMKRKDGTIIGAADFQHPEVRDFVFAPMEELATKYDLDGLELDWMRWGQMFSEDVPTDRRLAILTDYHRRIRKMLRAVGASKGKDLLLSIRVPQTLTECRSLGFDVAAYVREGLIDILCPSDFIRLDPRMRLDEFTQLTRGSKVALLPSLHPHAGEKAGHASASNLRAAAHSYYEQGADGISVFNWFTPVEVGKAEDFRTLDQLGDPAVLSREPREYLFNPFRDRESGTGRIFSLKTAVSRSCPGQREVLSMLIKENPDKVSAVLKCKLEYLTAQDEILIDVNGTVIESKEWKTTQVTTGKSAAITVFDESWTSGPYWLYEIDHAEQFLSDGLNEIGLTLVRPNPMLGGEIILFEVRLDITPG